jgi:hypothetical protein
MALKLSSRQLSQLAYLDTLPPKFERIHNVIEQMAGQQADESVVRGLGRVLDEIKAQSQAMGLGGISDTAGYMGTMARRGGSLQMKVRGLRELLGSLKTNYEGAVKAASLPERVDQDANGRPT